ncbi:hypothetical protein V6Z11_A07G031900 [Gossypium hirsutum]|uniref:Uncharacterized protein n=1 Tax=Gossypium hirsutum TaxID=3635 RepID=A0A1U8J041_GOSHI|nr:uncharacterized protein LOC107900479 [Gossypium hirsutum]
MVIEMFHNGQPKDEALFPLEIFSIKFSTATIQCCQGAIVRFDSTTLPFAEQKLYQDCRMQTEVYHLNSPQQNGNDSSKRWSLPPPGWVELNTDGAVALNHSWAAAGGVAKRRPWKLATWI